MKTATLQGYNGALDLNNFNPCSHEDCNKRILLFWTRSKISIHAVMKTATIVYIVNNLSIDISIHAVMKTATVSLKQGKSMATNFNPCSHEDCNSVAE